MRIGNLAKLLIASSLTLFSEAQTVGRPTNLVFEAHDPFVDAFAKREHDAIAKRIQSNQDKKRLSASHDTSSGTEPLSEANLPQLEALQALVTDESSENSEAADNPSMEQIKEDFRGIAPLFGHNLLSILVTDIYNMFADPGWQTVVQFFVDILYFCLLPVLGGVMSQSALYHYSMDPLTYLHVGLTQKSLWQPVMVLLKNYLYTVLGRPLRFDAQILEEVKEAVESADSGSTFVEEFVQPDELADVKEESAESPSEQIASQEDQTTITESEDASTMSPEGESDEEALDEPVEQLAIEALLAQVI